MEKPDYTKKPVLEVDLTKEVFDYLEASKKFDLSNRTIYSYYSGSIAYGTSTLDSDCDSRGIFVPKLEYAFGLQSVDQCENQTKDVCWYSLKKAFTLAYKNGPHLLEALFLDKKSVVVEHPIMTEILKHRHKFLSNQLKYSFGGYAWSQLLTAKLKKANNTGRQNLIQKYSYDTKMAFHAIRLFRMGAEACLTGEFNVLRPDAKELLEIRNGKYTEDEFAKFEKQDGKDVLVGGFAFEEKKKFEEAAAKSVLPAHPDFNFLNNLLVKSQLEFYKEKGELG